MRGGKNEERLYLRDSFELGIKATDMPDMPNLIARHKARYHLGAFLARPGMKVLDFPCGSGYGYDLFKDIIHEKVGGHYLGVDNDGPSIEYAKLHYLGDYQIGDMKKPYEMPYEWFDLICCIEGLEHIEKEYQEPLIERLQKALVPRGTLLVSMPEAPEKSGPNPFNPYHLHELTFNDFESLLRGFFNNVQIICHEDTLHNGKKANLMFGICRREGV